MSRNGKITWSNEVRKLSDLIPWTDNPKTLDAKTAEHLETSIEHFGLAIPLLISPDNEILDGNQRSAILEHMGDYGPDASLDVRVSNRPLTAKERRELVIRLRENQADWNLDMLADWDMGELGEWGFDADLLAGTAGSGQGESQDAEPQIDRAKELQEEWGTAVGQLWILPSRDGRGEHRLICGDCTDEAVVERILQTDKPPLMVTDPPYGVEYDPHWRDHIVGEFGQRAARGHGVDNDDTADWSLAWLLFPGDVCYVWHADRRAKDVQISLEATGFEIRNQVIWAKQHFAISRGNYHWQHEPCWYAVRKGKSAKFCDDRTQTTLWDIPSLNPAGRQEERYAHGTQKPIECMARPIRNHDAPIVYDPFVGSGTTLVACENLGRYGRAVEISPAYVAVALQRYLDTFEIRPYLANYHTS